jgi:hypothetical protein
VTDLDVPSLLDSLDELMLQGEIVDADVRPGHGRDCRCFGSDRTPGVAPQGVLGVGRRRRL